jgi:carbamoylphosphate synthase large subunit
VDGKVDANSMRGKLILTMEHLTHEQELSQYDIQLMAAGAALIGSVLARDEQKSYEILRHLDSHIPKQALIKTFDKIQAYNEWVVANAKNVLIVKDKPDVKFEL